MWVQYENLLIDACDKQQYEARCPKGHCQADTEDPRLRLQLSAPENCGALHGLGITIMILV